MQRFVLALALLAAPMLAHAIEEPAYEVLRPLGDQIEIRRYAPYVVAEVLVSGTAEDAGNQAFRILAGYIFGKNKGEKKLEMTAPVTQAAAPGGFLMQFVLPKGVTLESAPEPLDPRVQLREVAATRLAAIRYSGFWSQDNYDEHLAKLKAALQAADLSWTGEPVFSRYNPPFMPWFLRRNEIWLTLP